MGFRPEKIRRDFPVLETEHKGMPLVYLDSACVSLKPAQVLDAMRAYYEEFTACAGRSMHRLASRVTEEVHDARRSVARLISAKKPENVIFTRNTTEGINLVANSLGLEKGDEVLSSDKEHNSNLVPWLKLGETKGVRHKTFPFGDIDAFEEAITKNTRLVSVVHSSNLDGTTQDIRKITKIAHDYNGMVLVDAAQSAPHKEINVKRLGADFLAFSGHKMLGPSGTGVLYGTADALESLSPFIVGGDTVKNTWYGKVLYEDIPERFEAGLQDYAGIIGLGRAAEYLRRIIGDVERHEVRLNSIITERLMNLEGVEILGPAEPSLRGGIVSFTPSGIDIHSLALMLSESRNVMIRSGAHCVHSWFNARNIKGSDRASIYVYNTEEDAEIFCEELQSILEGFR